MTNENKSENKDSEASESIEHMMSSNETDLDKIHVGCFICHNFVPIRQTIVVVGRNELRAHICLKHLKKSEQTLPLHQAL